MQIVDELVSRSAEMSVRVDERRNNRSSCQIDVCGTVRDLDSSTFSHLDEAIVLHNEGGILDGVAPVTNNHARPLEHGDLGIGRRLRLWR